MKFIIMISSDTAAMRILIDDRYWIEFDVDVMDHDIPLIFYLERHKELHYSYNEVKNTFTNHMSNTTFSVIFLKDP